MSDHELSVALQVAGAALLMLLGIALTFLVCQAYEMASGRIKERRRKL